MSRPVPIERKKARGNPGHQKLPEPVVWSSGAVAVPPPPTTLTPGGIGEATWAVLWEYARVWLSPTTDIAVVTRYCEAHDRRMELTEVLATEGMFTAGSQGQRRMHPAWGARRDLEKDMLRLEASLGLTPADRARIGLAVMTLAEKRSALDQFRDTDDDGEGGDW